ncbi:MAG TPA: amidohydrolase family protein, partial [Acidimicrobiales bacterium]|nr:amidohydrolase family protein [Acidimicrobiales bacterium]
FQGSDQPSIGLNAVAGRPKDEYGVEPTSFEEMRDGVYDVDARVKDMSANGVLGSLCFPGVPGFCGRRFALLDDQDFGMALIRAYNDWMIDGWCGRHPERFIPCAIPSLINPEEMADEVRRMAALGCHTVSFTENPEKMGLPSFHSTHWDPFWQACCDEGTVICLHIGSSASVPIASTDAPIDVSIVLTPMNLFYAATDLVHSPVLRKYPGIKFALSEGGIGWIPYFLERLDYAYDQHRAWTGADFGSKLPSQVFREHVVTCFIDDARGLEQRHHIGVDSITWECDYPHSDSTWPHSPEVLWKSIGGLPDDEIDLITHGNAIRAFLYDPFRTRPRERCTVEFLRREVADWDVTIRSKGAKQRSDHTITGAEVFSNLGSRA